MKTILHLIHSVGIGGTESFVMNVFRNIDKKKYRMIFLCHSDKDISFKEELEKYGSKIYFVPTPRDYGIIKYIKKAFKILKDEKVDILHSHTYFNGVYTLFAACLAGVKIRIAHSHASWKANSLPKKIYWFLSKVGSHFFSTDKLACSDKAGKCLFFSKFTFIPNGINTTDFLYDESKRNNLRKKYNIKDNEILLGHVGRLAAVKNHIFMLKVLKKLSMETSKYKLMFVGGGEEIDNIKQFIKDNNLEEYCILVGSQPNANDYYNAFDLFLFPSFSEGLGMVAVEAQFNGLSVLASSAIPKEVNDGGHVTFLDLNENLWVEEIKKIDFARKDVKEYVENSQYNIKNTVNILEKIYDK